MGSHEYDELPECKDVNIEDVDPIIYPSEDEDEPNNHEDESTENVQKIGILMVGLDNAGKTKLLYTLQLGHVDHIITTIGYNVETLEYNDNIYEIWDIGGLKTVRVIRNFYAENKSFVIYVVDASDAARFEEAQEDLHDVMNNVQLANAGLIVLANKMDLVPEFTPTDLVKHLKLDNLEQKWKIYGCSAIRDGNRLNEIFDLLQT